MYISTHIYLTRTSTDTSTKHQQQALTPATSTSTIKLMFTKHSRREVFFVFSSFFLLGK